MMDDTLRGLLFCGVLCVHCSRFSNAAKSSRWREQAIKAQHAKQRGQRGQVQDAGALAGIARRDRRAILASRLELPKGGALRPHLHCPTHEARYMKHGAGGLAPLAAPMGASGPHLVVTGACGRGHTALGS